METQHQQVTKTSLSRLLLAMVLLALIMAVAVILIGYISNHFTASPSPQTVLVVSPACNNSEAEFASLVAAGQSVDLTKNLNTYAYQGKFVNEKTVIVNRSGTGEIACGYLDIKAHKSGDKPLNDTYDSIYVNPQGFGGHLLASRNILQGNDLELLLPLNSIPYLPGIYNPNPQNFTVANWATLLNVSNQTTFQIALSIQDSGAVIDDLTIAYKCWDPSSGATTTTNCQLGTQ